MFGKDKKEEIHEKILYEAQPNIFVYSKGILISMLALGFLFFLYSAGISYIGNMNVYLIETTKVPLTRYFAIAVFVMIMIVFAYIIIKLLIWTSIKYTITESRVIVEKGILLQKKNYMPFNTIQDISRTQSLFGKIFSVGTITLYSAYDGKEIELKDVSSPKKVEDIIFENMRGTHLRYRNIYDDNGSNFNPIRPHSDEPVHYRRMEDLDDLELVDAKERKRQIRENKRKAKMSRNNYNSNYNSNDYNSAYDDYYYDDYQYDDRNDDNRRNYGNYPNQHHQYSGAIKESYERNPDKYFANNYEEFHQSNLDAQREYQEQMNYDSYPNRHERAYYNNQADNYQDSVKENKKSKGLSRFNPFSSNNKDDVYAERNISDEEFDSTINQAMHDMDRNIKFEPSNNQYNHQYNNQYNNPKNRNQYNQQNANARMHNQAHNQKFNANYHSNHQNRDYYDDYGYGYDYEGSRNNYRANDYGSRGHYSSRDYGSRDSYRSQGYGSRDSYRSQGYGSRDSYRSQGYGSRDSYRSQEYDSRDVQDDYDSNYRAADYEDISHYEKSSSKNEKEGKEKNPDDLFEKHSRKFRR